MIYSKFFSVIFLCMTTSVFMASDDDSNFDYKSLKEQSRKFSKTLNGGQAYEPTRSERSAGIDKVVIQKSGVIVLLYKRYHDFYYADGTSNRIMQKNFK